MIKVTYEKNYPAYPPLKGGIDSYEVSAISGSQKISVACLLKDGRTWFALSPDYVGDTEYTVVEPLGTNITQVKHTIEQRVKKLVTKDNLCIMHIWNFIDYSKVKVYQIPWEYLVHEFSLEQLVLIKEHNDD